MTPPKFNAVPRHKIPKAMLAVKNWSNDEASLRQRGDLRVWIAGDVTDHRVVPDRRTPKGDPIYTDLAIETALTLRLVFHQPLRQIEGFVSSVLAFMGLDLHLPDHSMLSKARPGIFVRSPVTIKQAQPGPVVDGTPICSSASERDWRRHHWGPSRQDHITGLPPSTPERRHAAKVSGDTCAAPRQKAWPQNFSN